MAGNIKGIIVEIGGDTSGLQKALTKVNSATSNLSRELKGVNSLLKLDPSNTDLLVQKQDILNKEIEVTSKKLEELQKHEQAVAENAENLTEKQQKNYRALQREIVNTQTKLNALKVESSNWNKAGEAMLEFGEKVTNISGRLDKLGTSLTVGITLPVSALATGLINASKEFETAFTGVEKTVDGTTEQLETLKQGIKDLAEEIPSSTTEISAVAEAAGQLGIATDDILSFTKVMIDLGNSTNLSADEAASALAKFANITQMSAKDYDKLGSTIVDLGNNFATTEADIVSMATRLAATGELAGLSQPQILALATAMSSVGIEAEAGGSAMSKLLKKIQVAVETGNAELKDFAKVAGMTSSQFKKAFQKDAVNALSAFISGLNDTKRNGKSAIVILEEMELKEVRLSNTILSLANASNVLNGAVKVGNEAWDKNEALTNEANKRYATLESQMEITKNKIKNLATNVGNKLTPAFKDTLKQVDKVIDKLDDLSAEEIENIIQTTAFVATIGPATKIISVLGTTTGNTLNMLGNFSKAIANVKNGVTDAKGTVGLLTNTIKGLISPTSLAVAGITAVATATYAYAKKSSEEITSLNGIRDSLDSQREGWEKLKQARQVSLESTSNEIVILDNLANQLNNIVDSNGKVKTGYEDRANYIVTTLNNALGTEISLNKGIISNYQEIQKQIDNTIEKKKAEILLNAYADEYAEALKGQSEASAEIKELTNQMTEAQKEYAIETGKSKQEALFKINEISKAISEEKALLDEYQYTIGNYESLQTASISGTAEQLDTALENMKVSWQEYQTDTTTTIGGTSVAINEELSRIGDILNRNTSVKDASQSLGIETRTAYVEEVIKEQEEEKKNLKNIAEIIDKDTQVETSSGNLGADSSETFKINANSTAVGEDFTMGIAQGINNRSGEVFGAVQALGHNMIAQLRASIDSHSPSKKAMKVGNDFDEGVLLGIKDNKKYIFDEISSLGNESINTLNNSMLDLSNFERLNSLVTNDVIKKNNTIFTTPQIVFNVQELDREKLEQCFNYVNEKFGSAY